MPRRAPVYVIYAAPGNPQPNVALCLVGGLVSESAGGGFMGWYEVCVEELDRLADGRLRLDGFGPGQRLARARALFELARLADEMGRDVVAEARARGWSWTRIGREFGVSRQAAAKRFGGC